MADEVAAAAAQLHRPGLVVLTGPPGSGRSTALRRITAALSGPDHGAVTGPAYGASSGPGRGAVTGPAYGAVSGPVHVGGGLAMLQTVPALALSRAVRARLPAHDIHLLAEAVRSRVRGGLLVLDDLQYADPATLAALPHIAAHCRVLVALRTPHRLPAATVEALAAKASAWLTMPPMPAAEALELARTTAPQLDPASLSAVAARAGGNPLAIIALARQAAAGRAPTGIDQVAYAIATALADLSRPARTALAALGLLGRPAPAALLGAGAGDLLAAGLVVADPDGELLPVSTYLAETAAGLLDAAARVDLHTRLAELTPPAEAARHLAAAGDAAGAHRLALQAADLASGGERAALLLFACELDVPVALRVRIAAADAALATGRADAAARVLAVSRVDATPGGAPAGHDVDSRATPAGGDVDSRTTPPGGDVDARVTPTGSDHDSRVTAAVHRADAAAGSLGMEADVLRGEALLQAGDPAGARAVGRSVPDAAPASIAAARDRVLLLAELATDPPAATELADKISMRWPQPPPGVAAALAAVSAHNRTPGWDKALAAAAAGGGDPLITRWSAWLLVDHLIADGRLVEAATAALAAARECGAALAYGWQTRFTAAADWSLALHGTGTAMPDPLAGGAREAGHGDRAETEPHPAAGPTASARGAALPGSPPGDTRDAGDTQPRWDGVEGVLRRAANLADRALPDEARGYATAATALIEADTGLLGAARARLDAGPEHPATAWVARETAWLDGQPDRALREPADAGGGLLAGLHAITARWAAHDLGTEGAPPIPSGLPAAARRTLTAWATGTGFAAAADTWQPVALRERIRCLLAAGLIDTDPQRAVAALLSAEQLADTAGLTVLAGRARRGLRRHHVHRDVRSPRSGDQLTRRETDVLRLVAAGEPTRRIAGQLGISAETVDTHIRAGMRKLGARTRTEAAALAFANPADDTLKDGR